MENNVNVTGGIDQIDQGMNVIDQVNTLFQTIDTTLSGDKSKVEAVSISTQDYASIFVQVRQDLANVRADFFFFSYSVIFPKISNFCASYLILAQRLL